MITPSKPRNRRLSRRLAHALLAPLVLAWTAIACLFAPRRRLNLITSVQGLSAAKAPQAVAPAAQAAPPPPSAEIIPLRSAEIIDFPFHLAR